MKSRFPSRSKTESYAAGVNFAENEPSFGKNYRYANEVTESYAASVTFAENEHSVGRNYHYTNEVALSVSVQNGASCSWRKLC